MNIQRLALILTVVNLVLLAFILTKLRPAVAMQGVVPVLRGRELQIVDEQGRGRAQIKVLPPSKGPDGKAYAETVIFRLSDPKGGPGVKLGVSEEAAGLSLVTDSSSTYVVLKAEGTESSLKMINKAGREKIITP